MLSKEEINKKCDNLKCMLLLNSPITAQGHTINHFRCSLLNVMPWNIENDLYLLLLKDNYLDSFLYSLYSLKDNTLNQNLTNYSFDELMRNIIILNKGL
jgi:hypothetical protein